MFLWGNKKNTASPDVYYYWLYKIGRSSYRSLRDLYQKLEVIYSIRKFSEPVIFHLRLSQSLANQYAVLTCVLFYTIIVAFFSDPHMWYIRPVSIGDSALLLPKRVDLQILRCYIRSVGHHSFAKHMAVANWPICGHSGATFDTVLESQCL